MAARRFSPKSGHPEGKYFGKKGGGPGRYAKGRTAAQRNLEARRA